MSDPTKLTPSQQVKNTIEAILAGLKDTKEAIEAYLAGHGEALAQEQPFSLIVPLLLRVGGGLGQEFNEGRIPTPEALGAMLSQRLSAVSFEADIRKGQGGVPYSGVTGGSGHKNNKSPLHARLVEDWLEGKQAHEPDVRYHPHAVLQTALIIVERHNKEQGVRGASLAAQVIEGLIGQINLSSNKTNKGLDDGQLGSIKRTITRGYRGNAPSREEGGGPSL